MIVELGWFGFALQHGQLVSQHNDLKMLGSASHCGQTGEADERPVEDAEHVTESDVETAGQPTRTAISAPTGRFLSERQAAVGDRFITDLAAKQVTGFLVVECGRVSAGSAKGCVAELRALLRYPS